MTVPRYEAPLQYQQPVQQPPVQAEPPPFWYTPRPGTAAAELMGQLDEAKAAATEAAERVKSLVREIEAQVASDIAAELPPGSALPAEIRIAGGPFWQGRIMRWKIARTFNRKGFDAAYPGVYAAWITDGDGYWQLDPER